MRGLKNVLIACEESQRVCTAFREKGFNAFSCDILECSGGHPEWHVQGDALKLMRAYDFETMTGSRHVIHGWDLIIAHPPCTYLTCTGNRWFNIEKYGDKARERYKQRDKAAEFFMRFVQADCPHIAIENPIGYMSTFYRKPDQIVQPFWFGDAERKATCLWLKGLPKLEATKTVEPIVYRFRNGHTDPAWHMNTISLPAEERARARSKTFPGIAKAMAEQWGNYLLGD